MIADTLLAILDGANRAQSLFNPWRDTDILDIASDAAEKRAARLRAHLSVGAPEVLLVGEAAGYQGCRFSGVPFTSERLVCEGAIPRIAATPRFTSRKRPFSEPSATIVWKALFQLGIADTTIMWNALPLHPMKDGNPLSNRSPRPHELEIGIPCLEALRAHFPETAVIAVGLNASRSLTAIGIPHATVRHPANGGATQFTTGLSDFIEQQRGGGGKRNANLTLSSLLLC